VTVSERKDVHNGKNAPITVEEAREYGTVDLAKADKWKTTYPHD
jgi:hypothetical protein